MQQAKWHGTAVDSFAITLAVQNNCQCVIQNDVRLSTCKPHEMFLDQRVMDHMAFVKANVKRFTDGEFKV